MGCNYNIEIYHKMLKSGCKVEARQFETAARLERYLAVDSVVAWRILGLTMQSRETPDMSCEAFLDPDEWQALACYIKKTLTPPKQPPTLKQAALWIAQLGGFLGRKGGGYLTMLLRWLIEGKDKP
jgi:Transposase Tn5 dimerisation domain.